MTPTEQFAQKRLEAEQLIRQHAPERLQEQLLALLRLTIALSATRADDEQIPVGASKFGGAPDVPADFEWPMWNGEPLGFLAQINLEEVAPFDVEGLLPKSGLLSFFYRFADGAPRDVAAQTLLFATDALERRAPPSEVTSPDCQFVPAQTMDFSPEWTTREFYYTELEGIWDYDDYVDNFLPAFGKRKGTRRLLGQPVLAQDPVFLEAEMARLDLAYKDNEELLEHGANDWRLLLQLDFKLPDCYFGVCYFVLRQEDLAQQHWNSTQFFYQGS